MPGRTAAFTVQSPDCNKRYLPVASVVTLSSLALAFVAGVISQCIGQGIQESGIFAGILSCGACAGLIASVVRGEHSKYAYSSLIAIAVAAVAWYSANGYGQEAQAIFGAAALLLAGYLAYAAWVFYHGEDSGIVSFADNPSGYAMVSVACVFATMACAMAAFPLGLALCVSCSTAFALKCLMFEDDGDGLEDGAGKLPDGFVSLSVQMVVFASLFAIYLVAPVLGVTYDVEGAFLFGAVLCFAALAAILATRREKGALDGVLYAISGLLFIVSASTDANMLAGMFGILIASILALAACKAARAFNEKADTNAETYGTEETGEPGMAKAGVLEGWRSATNAADEQAESADEVEHVEETPEELPCSGGGDAQPASASDEDAGTSTSPDGARAPALDQLPRTLGVVLVATIAFTIVASLALSEAENEVGIVEVLGLAASICGAIMMFGSIVECVRDCRAKPARMSAYEDESDMDDTESGQPPVFCPEGEEETEVGADGSSASECDEEVPEPNGWEWHDDAEMMRTGAQALGALVALTALLISTNFLPPIGTPIACLLSPFILLVSAAAAGSIFDRYKSKSAEVGTLEEEGISEMDAWQKRECAPDIREQLADYAENAESDTSAAAFGRTLRQCEQAAVQCDRIETLAYDGYAELAEAAFAIESRICENACIVADSAEIGEGGKTAMSSHAGIDALLDADDELVEQLENIADAIVGDLTGQALEKSAEAKQLAIEALAKLGKYGF